MKLSRKDSIERNWQVSIDEVLPKEIRPRAEFKKGAKCRIGDQLLAEENWWNWSVEFIRGLDEFSRMTPGKLDWAQELLGQEVTRRQANDVHPQRRIIELLLGDVQRVIDRMKRHGQAAKIRGEEEVVDEEEGDVEEGSEEEGSEGEGNEEEGSGEEGSGEEGSEEEGNEGEGDEEEQGNRGETGSDGVFQQAEDYEEPGAHGNETGMPLSGTRGVRSNNLKRARSIDPIQGTGTYKRVRVTGSGHYERDMRSNEYSGPDQDDDSYASGGARVISQLYNEVGMPPNNPFGMRNAEKPAYRYSHHLELDHGRLPHERHNEMALRSTEASGYRRDSTATGMHNHQLSAGGACIAGMQNSTLVRHDNSFDGTSVACMSHAPVQTFSNSIGNAPIAGLSQRALAFPGSTGSGNYAHTPYADSVATQQAKSLAIPDRGYIPTEEEINALRISAFRKKAESDRALSSSLLADSAADHLAADQGDRRRREAERRGWTEGDDYSQ